MKRNMQWVLGMVFLGAMVAQAKPLPAKAEGTTRFLTYNIQNGKGMDGKFNLEETARVIREVNADWVALQELDWFTRRTPQALVSNLAVMVGMEYVYGPAIDYQGGKYGVAILAKTKPLTTRQIALPGCEKRTALIAEYPDLYFVCTHFALQEEARVESAQKIAEFVEASPKPVILAGDMNANLEAPSQKSLAESFLVLSDTTRATWPANKPRQFIDYIYGSKAHATYQIIKTEVLAEPTASDHRPVYADVKISPKKE